MERGVIANPKQMEGVSRDCQSKLMQGVIGEELPIQTIGKCYAGRGWVW